MKKKAVKPPFEPGDIVTGLDRSYKRSIYKILSSSERPEDCVVEFQSLGRQVVDAFKNDGRPKSFYVFLRRYDEFRYATRNEFEESERSRATYRLVHLLNRLNVTHMPQFGFSKF